MIGILDGNRKKWVVFHPFVLNWLIIKGRMCGSEVKLQFLGIYQAEICTVSSVIEGE